MGSTYRNLVPGPYWPDSGHAHTTFRAWLVILVVVALRSSKMLTGTLEGRTGMIFQEVLKTITGVGNNHLGQSGVYISFKEAPNQSQIDKPFRPRLLLRSTLFATHQSSVKERDFLSLSDGLLVTSGKRSRAPARPSALSRMNPA